MLGTEMGRTTVRNVFCVLAMLSLLLIGIQSAHSEEQTVALSVGMGCPTCPYIVKKSLEDVAGVQAVKVLYREQEALVTFDDAKTTVAALTEATAAVGFPSRLIK